ncbi:retrovirus-related pol polyprotein from transposon TNT 1-94 [Tanacetum coccineum]
MQEVILFYNGLEVPTRKILDSKGVIPSKTVADAKVAIQEMAEYSQKWHNGTSRTKSTKTSDGLAAIHAQLNSPGREIKKVNEKERGFGSLPSSTEANPRDHVKSISTTVEADTNSIRRKGSPQYAVSSPQNRRLMFESRQMTIPFPSCLNDYYCEEKNGSYGPNSRKLTHMKLHISTIPYPERRKTPEVLLYLGLGELAHNKLTVELADRTVKYPKGIAENVLVGIGKFVFPVDFIILDMSEDVKVPLILGRPFLSTDHAKIDVFKRKITLRVGNEKIIFKSVKPASSLIKRVYMLGLRDRMKLDLEARLMGETLVLNRSLDPLYGDYIELNDLNVPLELRRDQVDDLMPTIEEGEVIDEPMINIIKTRNNESFDEDLYNSTMRDKVEYKGKNVVGAFMNVPISVRNFSVVTYFAILENMDGYRD